jgi:hypothetical protein
MEIYDIFVFMFIYVNRCMKNVIISTLYTYIYIYIRISSLRHHSLLIWYVIHILSMYLYLYMSIYTYIYAYTYIAPMASFANDLVWMLIRYYIIYIDVSVYIYIHMYLQTYMYISFLINIYNICFLI